MGPERSTQLQHWKRLWRGAAPVVLSYKRDLRPALQWPGADGETGVTAAPLFNSPGFGRFAMNALRVAGVILIVLGLAGFFTGGFSFTKETTQAKIGPLELTVKDKESVNVPQWLSLGAIALGAVVLVLGFRKS
jgi:hypothetical protein